MVRCGNGIRLLHLPSGSTQIAWEFFINASAFPSWNGGGHISFSHTKTLTGVYTLLVLFSHSSQQMYLNPLDTRPFA